MPTSDIDKALGIFSKILSSAGFNVIYDFKDLSYLEKSYRFFSITMFIIYLLEVHHNFIYTLSYMIKLSKPELFMLVVNTFGVTIEVTRVAILFMHKDDLKRLYNWIKEIHGQNKSVVGERDYRDFNKLGSNMLKIWK